MNIPLDARTHAQQLLDYIDASPSPWHAVAAMVSLLQAHGFHALNESEKWSLQPHGRYYVVRGGSSIIAFILGEQALDKTGLRLVGAHTDSPGLRLKPKPFFDQGGYTQLGVEVYGGPILATFADRDLSLAGRVNVRHQHGFTSHLIKFDNALVRLPNLAIHMNREVNEKGLKFNKQTELPLIFNLADTMPPEAALLAQIAHQLNTTTAEIINWELNLYDTQKGNFWGHDGAFIADSQLDNLASCHAAIMALLSADNGSITRVCALFDHEEVGSESLAGAAGSFMQDTVNRIFTDQGLDQEAYYRAIANSFFISADMAHAYHPNYPSAYDAQHQVLVNHGPVIKTNSNQRYSTSADTAARIIGLCETAGIPYQQYVHRTDLGCGSTIGPMVAARMGIASVDIGNPMWAMHSIRESAGTLDHCYMINLLKTHFAQ